MGHVLDLVNLVGTLSSSYERNPVIVQSRVLFLLTLCPVNVESKLVASLQQGLCEWLHCLSWHCVGI